MGSPPPLDIVIWIENMHLHRSATRADWPWENSFWVLKIAGVIVCVCVWAKATFHIVFFKQDKKSFCPKFTSACFPFSRCHIHFTSLNDKLFSVHASDKHFSGDSVKYFQIGAQQNMEKYSMSANKKGGNSCRGLMIKKRLEHNKILFPVRMSQIKTVII